MALSPITPARPPAIAVRPRAAASAKPRVVVATAPKRVQATAWPWKKPAEPKPEPGLRDKLGDTAKHAKLAFKIVAGIGAAMAWTAKMGAKLIPDFRPRKTPVTAGEKVGYLVNATAKSSWSIGASTALGGLAARSWCPRCSA